MTLPSQGMLESLPQSLSSPEFLRPQGTSAQLGKAQPTKGFFFQMASLPSALFLYPAGTVAKMGKNIPWGLDLHFQLNHLSVTAQRAQGNGSAWVIEGKMRRLKGANKMGSEVKVSTESDTWDSNSVKRERTPTS